jgi:hypothetical protein
MPASRKKKSSHSKALLTGLFGLAAVFSAVTFDPGEKCGGKERWPLKILTDDKVASINFHPKPATIEQLTSISTPGTGTKTPRIDGIEDQVYQLSNVKILRARGEDDDDIHLVVLDDAGHHMIAEIPYFDCDSAKTSGHSEQYKKARVTFLQHKNDFFNIHWNITGVAFVDVQHGRPQDGVADNNIELHPVINLVPAN